MAKTKDDGQTGSWQRKQVGKPQATEPPPMQLVCFARRRIWPEIGRKYRPKYRFPANIPVANPLKTNLRLLFRLHGMEEVVGSIPTRSTKLINHLQANDAVKTAEKLVPIATLMLRVLPRAQLGSPHPKSACKNVSVDIQNARTPCTSRRHTGILLFGD